MPPLRHLRRNGRPGRPLLGLRHTPARLPLPPGTHRARRRRRHRPRPPHPQRGRDRARRVRPQTRGYRPRGAGHLLLCTDGLWRQLPGPAALRDRLYGAAPLDGARSLVQHALDAGATDNTTALLIRLG